MMKVGLVAYLDFVGDVGDVQEALFGLDGNVLVAVIGAPVKPLVVRRRIAFRLAFQARRFVQRYCQLLTHSRPHVSDAR